MDIRENENVVELYKKKAASITTATASLIAATQDWQVIKQFLSNRLEEIKLTAVQEKKLERYQLIYSKTASGKYTDSEILNFVTNAYGIKPWQYYEDLKCTREIYGSVIPVNKKFEINIQLQVNRDMLRKAAEISDLRAYAMLEKNRVALLSQLQDEDEATNDFIGHEMEVTFDPRKLGAADLPDMKRLLDKINEKRSVKIKTDMFEELQIQNPDEERTPL